ncbi:MAG: nitroreductase family protein [Promethearchaeota archaeon]
MSIKGVDESKCTACGACVEECPALCFRVDGGKEGGAGDSAVVAFSNERNWCIACGHCVAVCPVDAVLHEGFGDAPEPALAGLGGGLRSAGDFLRFLKSKRSVRRYSPGRLAREELDVVLEAVRYAPSAKNAREFGVTLVDDPEMVRELSEEVQRVISGHPALGVEYGEKFNARLAAGRDPVFFNAPVVLVLHSRRGTGFEATDAGIALTYASLAAQAAGIGSCWVGLAQVALNQDRRLRKRFGVGGRVWGVLALGRPAVKYRRTPPRAPLRVGNVPEREK